MDEVEQFLRRDGDAEHGERDADAERDGGHEGGEVLDREPVAELAAEARETDADADARAFSAPRAAFAVGAAIPLRATAQGFLKPSVVYRHRLSVHFKEFGFHAFRKRGAEGKCVSKASAPQDWN